MAPSKRKDSVAACTAMKAHVASAVHDADEILESPDVDPFGRLHAQHLKNILTLVEEHIKVFRFMPKDAASLPKRKKK